MVERVMATITALTRRAEKRSAFRRKGMATTPKRHPLACLRVHDAANLRRITPAAYPPYASLSGRPTHGRPA